MHVAAGPLREMPFDRADHPVHRTQIGIVPYVFLFA
jgi:hypothetical protein